MNRTSHGTLTDFAPHRGPASICTPPALRVSALLRDLSEIGQAQLDAWSAEAPKVPASRLSAGLTPLTRRWALEQELVFPALVTALRGDHAPFEHEERELTVLHCLVSSLPSADAEQQRALFAVLGGIAEVHAERVDRLLARAVEAGIGVDWESLARVMEDRAERWSRQTAGAGRS